MDPEKCQCRMRSSARTILQSRRRHDLSHGILQHGNGVGAAQDLGRDQGDLSVETHPLGAWVRAGGRVERLRRTTWAYWSNRDGADGRTPATTIEGPKCILINQYAGSGGDAFPHYFRLAGVGPIIGKRTWGGLVGISHDLPLVDGGSVTMPDFGMYDPRTGQWLVENHGVDPDIEVENAPHLLVEGRDPQLERGIQYCLEQLKTSPPVAAKKPEYKVQEGLGGGATSGRGGGHH